MRRLVAPAARHIDRAEQHLQQMQRAAGLEPVRVGRDPAHRMQRDRPAAHRLVAPPGPVGPRHGELDFLLEGGAGHLGGEPANRRGRNAAGLGDGLRRVARIEIALGHQLEDRHGAPAVGQHRLADEAGRNSGRHAAGERSRRFEDERLAGLVAGEEPVIRRARRLDHQPAGVGVAAEIVDIDPVGLQQFVDQREHEKPVGAGPDADPFVGDRRITGAHRVDRDEFGAAPAQTRQRDLDRVRIMVFGDAEHHEEPGARPIGLAELPEAAAERVHAGGRHIDRAEAAMRGEVRRPELRRPISGQRLALIAPGEEGELFRVRGADRRQPLDRRRDRLLPLDLAELAGAALADPLAAAFAASPARPAA